MITLTTRSGYKFETCGTDDCDLTHCRVCCCHTHGANYCPHCLEASCDQLDEMEAAVRDFHTKQFPEMFGPPALNARRGLPATMFYLTIEHDRLMVQYTGTHNGADVSRVITSREDLVVFLTSKANEAGLIVEALTVLCSSKIDHPEQYSRRKATIELCREIRGTL